MRTGRTERRRVMPRGISPEGWLPGELRLLSTGRSGFSASTHLPGVMLARYAINSASVVY
jgi:hypothetical protein